MHPQNVWRKETKNRVIISSSEEEETELLDKTSSSEEENVIIRKTKHVLRFISSYSELEIEEQEILQSQAINKNDFTPAVSITDMCWSHQNLCPKVHNFDEKESGSKAALDNMAKPLDYFQLYFSESLVDFIVKHTNNYHNYIATNRTWKINSRINS